MQDLVILMAGHFLADFPLQPEHMLRDKKRAFQTALGTLTLVAHAFIHFFVALFILVVLGAQEAFLAAVLIGATHFLIDAGKVRGLYGVMADQILHWFVLAVVALTYL